MENRTKRLMLALIAGNHTLMAVRVIASILFLSNIFPLCPRRIVRRGPNLEGTEMSLLQAAKDALSYLESLAPKGAKWDIIEKLKSAIEVEEEEEKCK